MTLEDPLPSVPHGPRLAVHDAMRPDGPAAERLAEALVPEAHAEHRHALGSEALRKTSMLTPASAGVHGPGETTTRSGPISASSSTLRASFRTTTGLAPRSPEELHEVERERVVVVDDEQHAAALEGPGAPKP
jgi:hypothetical protein